MRHILIRTLDARPLAMCRILVALSALLIALEWGVPLMKVASGNYLAMPVISGWPPMTTTGVLLLIAVTLAGSLAMIVGIAGRLPALLVALCAAVSLLSDQQAYSNHLLLLVTLVMFVGFSGAANAYSLFRGPGRSIEVPYWPAFLIKVQITTLYAWAAASKVNAQYLAGDVLKVQLLPWVPLQEQLLPALAVMSIGAEAFLAVALWIPKLRLIAFVVGGGLHVGILAMLHNPFPLIPFAMLMMCGYILFAHDSLQAGQWQLPRFARRASVPTPAEDQASVGPS